MSDDTNLSCPFCDGLNLQAHHRGNPLSGEWVIECHDCSCELTGFSSEQDAWKCWNDRLPVNTTYLAAEVERLRDELTALTLERDAMKRERHLDSERLDWLEQNGAAQFQLRASAVPEKRWFDQDTVGSDYSPTLRAAIDAARGQQP